MSNSLPAAKSQTEAGQRQKLRRMVRNRGLCGLANNTKWDEFIEGIRSREGWWPKFRCKCIDGPPSQWDSEWCYHLPFPLMSVEWLDVAFLEETREHRLPPRIHTVDHSPWIEELLQRAGLEHEKGAKMIRIFGYSPKNYDLFDA